jgi:uncharacterized protein
MRTFFFGGARRLNGVLHEAQGAAKSTGVLLCYPGVQEYNLTHWAFRKLAGLLARQGFHSLRFDYSCTGDSAGDVYDADLEHHLEDIVTAADELKDAAGVRRVSVIGMRLGALLAARAVSQGLSVRELLLWEPVFEGRAYVEQLEQLDHHLASRKHHRITQPRIELAGYPFPSRMRAQLEALSLEQSVPKAAGRVAMFLMADSAKAEATGEAWRRAGVATTSRVVREESGGLLGSAGDGDSAVHYNAMLSALVEHLQQHDPAKVAA